MSSTTNSGLSAPGESVAARWARRQRRMRRVTIAAMLAPAIGTLMVLYVGPLLLTLFQSFGHAPIYRVTVFPSLEYYSRVLTSTRFWVSLWYTLYYAFVPTIISTVVGVVLALLMNRSFWGARFFTFFFRLPLVVPYLVGAGMVVALFANGGLFARAFYALGMIEQTGDFPRILYSSNGYGIMLVYLFKQIPFTTMIVGSVLAGVSSDYEEVARTLGASRWKTFWHVILPRIMPGVVNASILVFAFNFQSYEIPYLLGATFPNTLPVEALRRFNVPDYTRRPEAMAYVVVIALISGVILFFYLKGYRRYERSKGGV